MAKNFVASVPVIRPSPSDNEDGAGKINIKILPNQSEIEQMDEQDRKEKRYRKIEPASAHENHSR